MTLHDIMLYRKVFLFLVVFLCKGRSGWIDPDTQHAEKFLKSLKDNRVYELVFSDEFNTDGR